MSDFSRVSVRVIREAFSRTFPLPSPKPRPREQHPRRCGANSIVLCRTGVFLSVL